MVNGKPLSRFKWGEIVVGVFMSKETEDFEADEDLDLSQDDEQFEESETEEDEADSENDDVESEDDEGESNDESDDDEDESDVIVSIDGESSSQDEEEKAPGWVRDLRKAHRDTQRENKELKAKLDEISGNAKKAELGAKPTLESSDYDEEVYERNLTSWYERKREFDARQEEIEAEQQKAEQEYLDRVKNYEDRKKKLKLKDFDFAEDFVASNFTEQQQAMIVNGADDPAVLVYALGKNQKLAKDISSIKDPVKFAFAVSKLETKLKVTNRKATTKPEKKIAGSGNSSGAVDSHLERLREEASKTGDFSKLHNYKRKLKAKK